MKTRQSDKQLKTIKLEKQKRHNTTFYAINFAFN